MWHYRGREESSGFDILLCLFIIFFAVFVSHFLCIERQYGGLERSGWQNTPRPQGEKSTPLSIYLSKKDIVKLSIICNILIYTENIKLSQ